MQYEDRLTIATPEGVSMDVGLAGIGSRLGAAVIDGFIQGGLFIALAFVMGALASGSRSGNPFPGGPGGSDSEIVLLTLALLNVILFAVLFFYFVLFETLWSGRTPGKRAFGIRVVQTSGARVGFKASMVRNLLRIVDLLPAFYLAGISAILFSERNQRVGDMIAGTVVVRDRPSPTLPSTAGGERAGPPQGTESWDVSAITGEELAALRGFLERRHTIPGEVRTKLATDLERNLRPKVPGSQAWEGYPEVFLETLAAVKSARS